MTDALLRNDENEVGKTKSSVVMPKGFEELPQTDPQYQGVQGFNFGDFPSLGGKGSVDTTSKVTKGKGKATEEDVGRTERPVGEKELGSSLSPVTVGKATEPTVRSGEWFSHSCSCFARRSAGSPCAAAKQPPFSLSL
jgi:hypothetical protein